MVRDNGQLSTAELFHLRVRYMTEGAAMGGESFVEDVFIRFRDQFSAKRASGARRARMLSRESLFVARDLKRRVFS